MQGIINASGAGGEAGGQAGGESSGHGGITWVGDGNAPFMSPLDIREPAQPCFQGERGNQSQHGFPDQWWAPVWRSQLVLAEFAAKTKWMALEPPELVDSEDKLRSEISELIGLRNERASRMDEIISQADSFVDCWTRLLGANGNRPNTQILINAGVSIGLMVVMYWKARYKRARPAQVFPLLLPPIPTPGHPSYPSGHSLQNHLIARLLRAAFPAEIRDPMGDIADAMARRIAENREVAGLHYHQDTEAGEDLAIKIAPLVMDLDIVKREVVPGVLAEWSGITVGLPPEKSAEWLTPQKVIAQAVADLINPQSIADAVAQRLGKP